MLDYSVRRIPPSQTHEWLLNKHYAHRLPPISLAFGLYRADILVGVCTFAKPMSWSLQIGICGEDKADFVLELNRLVINDNQPNLASHFIASCLKQLPHPTIVVSYADTAQNHHGYIYQATNFLYTGMSKPFKEYALKNNEQLHAASIGDMVGRSDKIGHGHSKFAMLKEKFGDDVYWRDRSLKHRYIKFLGSKMQVKELKSLLKYPVMPYPKGDNKRYDASYNPSPQGILI